MSITAVVPRSAKPIGIKPLTDDQIRTKYQDRTRWGKTARDRAKLKQAA